MEKGERTTYIYTVNWVWKKERREEEGWTHFGPRSSKTEPGLQRTTSRTTRKNWLLKASKQRLSTPLDKECKCCKEGRNQKDTKEGWPSENFKDEPSKSSHRNAKKMRRKWWNGKGRTSLQRDRLGIEEEDSSKEQKRNEKKKLRRRKQEACRALAWEGQCKKDPCPFQSRCEEDRRVEDDPL